MFYAHVPLPYPSQSFLSHWNLRIRCTENRCNMKKWNSLCRAKKKKKHVQDLIRFLYWQFKRVRSVGTLSSNFINECPLLKGFRNTTEKRRERVNLLCLLIYFFNLVVKGDTGPISVLLVHFSSKFILKCSQWFTLLLIWFRVFFVCLFIFVLIRIKIPWG